MNTWLVGLSCLFFVPTAVYATPKVAPSTSRKAKVHVRKTPTKRTAQPSKSKVPLYEKDAPVLPEPSKNTALGRILNNQAIRVCVRTDVPPFGYFSNTGLTGFDIDLAKQIAVQLSIFYKKNLLISWISIHANARIKSLQNNHCDMVIAAFSYTKSRAKQIAFTKRYLKTDKVIVSNTQITRKQPIIALVRGTTNSAKGLKGQIKRYNSYKEIIFAMEQGDVDYIVADRPIALHMIRSVTKSFRIVRALPQTELYGIGVRRNHPHLLSAINRALDALARSGRLAYLHRQWL